jgi:hypothetical protein
MKRSIRLLTPPAQISASPRKESQRSQVREHRTHRRRDHLVLAELGEVAVDLVEQLVTRQWAALALDQHNSTVNQAQ